MPAWAWMIFGALVLAVLILADVISI